MGLIKTSTDKDCDGCLLLTKDEAKKLMKALKAIRKERESSPYIWFNSITVPHYPRENNE